MVSLQNQIGINILDSKLQVVEVSYTDGDFVLEDVDEITLNKFFSLNNDKEKIIADLQNAFDKSSPAKSIKDKNLSFALPHNIFQITQLPVENSLLDNDLAGQLKWEYSILFPYLNNDELLLQFLKLGGSDSSTVVAAGLQKKYVEILKEFCNQNEANLQYVDYAHFASDSLLSLEEGLSEQSMILSMYLSNDYLSINLLNKNKPVEFQTYLTRQISDISVDLNKFIKMSKHLAGNQKLISRAYFSGGSIPDSLLLSLEKVLGFSISILNPFRRIKINQELQNNKFVFSNSNAFTAAAGIAYRMIP